MIRRAFTIVEIMVVVAIIGVLVALLLPAIGMVKQSALAVRCQSNLRQLGLGSSLYQGENDGFFPGRYWQNEINDFVNPGGLVGSTVVDGGVRLPLAVCPAAPPKCDDGSALNNCTYSLVGVSHLAYGTSFFGIGSGAPECYLHAASGAVVRPADKALIVEQWMPTILVGKVSSCWGTNMLNGLVLRSVHSGKTQILFADYHVQKVTVGGRLPSDWVQWESSKADPIFLYGSPLPSAHAF